MKTLKKKKSIKSLDDAYLDAIRPEEGLAEESIAEKPPLEKIALDGDLKKDESLKSEILAGGTDDKIWQGKEFIVANDAMSVTLKLDSGSAISTYQINHALKELGVKYGIDWQKLAKAEQISKFGGTAEIIVARGTPPGIKKMVKYLPVKKIQIDSERVWVLGKAQIDFDHLATVYERQELTSLDNNPPRVIAVNPGETIVQIEVNEKAQSGHNVFGAELLPIEDSNPEIGKNVRFNQETKTIEANIFGYLHISSEILSVLPPIWITEDRQKAYFIDLPQLDRPKIPTSTNLKNLLIMTGLIEQCKHNKLIDIMCQKLAQGKKLKTRYVLIAEAIQPKTGKDATIKLCFDNEIKAGMIRSDGSLDLRERNAVVSIKAGDQIAVKIKASKGIDGIDILGNKIRAKDGQDLNITADTLVRVEKDKDKVLYFAKKSGNVKFKNNKLTIADIYKIHGDVDYKSGNININTDLQITGSVLPGFSVKAKGSIDIQGAIENDASVFAEGDVSVKKGIRGVDTEVIVLGNLHTSFIQDAQVIVRGEAIIASYTYNSMLRTSGNISILKAQGRKSGRAVGGITCSAKDISLSTAGNTGNAHTVLAIQADPETTQQLTKLEKGRQLCEQNVAKITRTLPFDNFTPAFIKEKLAKLPPAQRETMVQLLTNLNKFIKQQKVQKEQAQKIKDEINHSLNKAKIRITSKIFLGCEIQIGEKKLLLNEDLGPTIFQLEDGNITK